MPKTDTKKVTSASSKKESELKKKKVVESSSESDSSSESESSDSSSSSSSAPVTKTKNGKTNGKTNGKEAAKVNGKKKPVSSSSSESSSESSSDSESDAPATKKRGREEVIAAPKKKVASASSSSSSSSESDSDSDSDDSSSSSSEEAVTKPAAKKQKLSEDSFNVTAKEPVKTAGAAAGGTRVFIRNLPWSIQDGDIHSFFEECGTVTGIKWFENKETGRFTGTGILDFETEEAASKAVAKNGSDLKGRPVGLEFSRAAAPGGDRAGGDRRFGGDRGGDRQDRGNFKKAEASNSFDKKNARAPTPKPDGCRTIFVGNLSFSVDDAKMTEFFSSCGEVKEIRWVERDGQFKGCGFIEFTESSATDNAVGKNGASFLGRPIRVDFAPGKN
jgi:nucleolin